MFYRVQVHMYLCPNENYSIEITGYPLLGDRRLLGQIWLNVRCKLGTFQFQRS